MDTSLVHSELTLLTKACRTIFTCETFLDVGMNANLVSTEIVTRCELFGTDGTHETTFALVFDDVMFGEGVFASEGFGAGRVLACEATRTVRCMNLGNMALEFASTTKGGGTKRAN